jgi:hypothetical protein
MQTNVTTHRRRADAGRSCQLVVAYLLVGGLVPSARDALATVASRRTAHLPGTASGPPTSLLLFLRMYTCLCVCACLCTGVPIHVCVCVCV